MRTWPVKSARTRTLHTTLVLAALASRTTFAQLPGYEIVHVTNDSYENSYMDLNDCGQMVFIKRIGEDWNLNELYLYDNGKTFRLTTDLLGDIVPEISNLGTIIWAKNTDGFGDTDAIVAYRDGQISTLAYNPEHVGSPAINHLDQMAWSDWLGMGCEDSDADIMFFDGVEQHRLTAGGFNHQSQAINEPGHIAFTRYDFCPDPWVSEILFYRDGEIAILPRSGRYP